MRMKALGTKASAPAALASPTGILKLSIRPLPAAVACKKARRETPFVGSAVRHVTGSRNMSPSLPLCRLLDRFANADIGPAAADIAEHGVVDVGVGRIRIAGDERRGRHDLARLAIAALHYLAVEPRFLNLSASRRCADRLNRRDFRGTDTLDRSDTRAGGSAVDMYRAGATQRHAAAEFCAGHAEHVAQHP